MACVWCSSDSTFASPAAHSKRVSDVRHLFKVVVPFGIDSREEDMSNVGINKAEENWKDCGIAGSGFWGSIGVLGWEDSI